MLLDNLYNSVLIIISLISFITFLIIYKIANLNKLNLFLDKDFNKPQAFHNKLIPRIGGLASVISLTIFFSAYSFFFNISIFEYLYFSILLFFIGFLDDAKISLKPIIRLILMITIIIIGINLFDIKITKTGFFFLNNWLENNLFQYCFLILCFLFIINGANLVDGFNGLLIIHLIIINIILFFIHLENQNIYFSSLLIGQIFTMFCFFLFNFPSAKMFMGDSGAYLFGSITALNAINTSTSYPEITPFFFVTLLFYLFFEVFFSFSRKIKSKKSPLQPDSQHLHMLVFKFLDSKKLFKTPNPMTSFFINLFFLVLLLPPAFLKENSLFCRYWILIQLFVYVFMYFKFYNFTKKIN